MLRPYQDNFAGKRLSEGRKTGNAFVKTDDFAGKRLSSGRKTGNAFVKTDDFAGKRLSDGRKNGGWVWNLKWLCFALHAGVADCVIEM